MFAWSRMGGIYSANYFELEFFSKLTQKALTGSRWVVNWYARTTQYAMFVLSYPVLGVFCPGIAWVTLTHSNSAVWETARYVNVKSITLQWHLKTSRPWQNDTAISKLGILGHPQPVPSRFYSLVFNKQGGPDTVAPKVADCSSSWHFITETRHTFALLTHPDRFCYLRSMRDWEIPDWKLPSCSCLPFLSAIKGVGHMTRPPPPSSTLRPHPSFSLPATPRTRTNCSLTRPKQQKQQSRRHHFNRKKDSSSASVRSYHTTTSRRTSKKTYNKTRPTYFLWPSQ